MIVICVLTCIPTSTLSKGSNARLNHEKKTFYPTFSTYFSIRIKSSASHLYPQLRITLVHRTIINSANKSSSTSVYSESYRNALQAFIERRRFPEDTETDAPCSPDKSRADLLAKTNNSKRDNERKSPESKSLLPGVPHIPASEIFEIGWVAGTEDRYVELIFAEWQNTRVSLKRHTHPDCKDAVKADLDVLS